MMNKYGVSDICPECGQEAASLHVKLGNGTIQEQVKCNHCGFEMVHIISEAEESKDDSQPE